MRDIRNTFESLNFSEDQDKDAKMLEMPAKAAKERVDRFRDHKKQYSKVKKIYDKSGKTTEE
eukprot:11902786-Alexandrium_andersonii.AAC.1